VAPDLVMARFVFMSFLLLQFCFKRLKRVSGKRRSIPWVAGTLAGLKKYSYSPCGRNNMTTVGFHIGTTGFPTLLIYHPL
jgi:hypothetical protein